MARLTRLALAVARSRPRRRPPAGPGGRPRRAGGSGPHCRAGRIVSVLISRVARVRSPPLQGGVDGEVHAGVEQQRVDPGLDDPVRVAGQVGGDERTFHPAQILALHAVGVEGASHGADDRHAAVAQPAVHVPAPFAGRPAPCRSRYLRSHHQTGGGGQTGAGKLPTSRPAGPGRRNWRRSTMTTAVIVDAVRTAGGKRNGKLRNWHAVDLASEPLRALQQRNDLDPGPGRRRHHRLRHAGSRAVAERRSQRRVGRRLARVGAGDHHRPSVRFVPAGHPLRRPGGHGRRLRRGRGQRGGEHDPHPDGLVGGAGPRLPVRPPDDEAATRSAAGWSARASGPR